MVETPDDMAAKTIEVFTRLLDGAIHAHLFVRVDRIDERGAWVSLELRAVGGGPVLLACPARGPLAVGAEQRPGLEIACVEAEGGGTLAMFPF